MPDFTQRSGQAEIMDDLTYAGKVMDQTLAELEIINTWLGGNSVTMSGLKVLLGGNIRKNTLRIADLGCGSGDILKIINKWAHNKGQSVELVGIDANPYIIAAATKNLKGISQVELQCIDIFSPDFQRQQFDVVIGTLFFHHFSDEQLVELFTVLKNQTGIGFIINDVHRHPLAFYSIWILTKLFSKSSMVKYDAPLSVLRAFTREELTRILVNAGITNFRIRWKWAFRWQVLVYNGPKSQRIS